MHLCYTLSGARPKSGSIFKFIMHPNQHSSIMCLWLTASVPGSELVAFTVTQRGGGSQPPRLFTSFVFLGLPILAFNWGSRFPLPSGAPGPRFCLGLPAFASIYLFCFSAAPGPCFCLGSWPLLSSGAPGPHFRLGLPALAFVWGSRSLLSTGAAGPRFCLGLPAHASI